MAPPVVPPACLEEVHADSSEPLFEAGKKGVYCRQRVQEYLAWITREQRLVWWELRLGEYSEIAPMADGVLKSGIFPGLWLDTQALLGGRMKQVLASLRAGLSSPEHRAFVGD